MFYNLITYFMKCLTFNKKKIHKSSLIKKITGNVEVMLPSFGPQLTKNKGLTINNNCNWKHARDSREAGSGALVTCAKCMSQRQSPCKIRNRKVYGGTRIRPEKPVNHIWTCVMSSQNLCRSKFHFVRHVLFTDIRHKNEGSTT